MAAVKGLVKTAVDAQGVANWQLSGLIDGRVKASFDSYTALGTETAGSTIQMGQVLPTGANVIGILLSVSASTGSLTVSVGDNNSATRYASASTSPATAGSYLYGGKQYIVGTNVGTSTTSDNQLLLTTGGATIGVGLIITTVVLYTID